MKDFRTFVIALNRMRSRFNTQLQPPKKTTVISQLFGPKVKNAVCQVGTAWVMFQVCSLHPRPRIQLRPSGTVAGLMPNKLGVASRGMKMEMKIIK